MRGRPAPGVNGLVVDTAGGAGVGGMCDLGVDDDTHGAVAAAGVYAGALSFGGGGVEWYEGTSEM